MRRAGIFRGMESESAGERFFPQIQGRPQISRLHPAVKPRQTDRARSARGGGGQILGCGYLLRFTCWTRSVLVQKLFAREAAIHLDVAEILIKERAC